MRWLAARARVALQDVRQGTVDTATLRQAAEEWREAAGRLAFITGSDTLSVSQLEAQARETMCRQGAGRCLVVVDSLPLWARRSREFGATQTIHERLGVLATSLGSLAASLDSPVLALAAQASQPLENDRAPRDWTPDTVSVSADLSFAADMMMVLVEARMRGEKPPARAVDLVVAKNRYGRTGTIALVFRPTWPRYDAV